LIVVSKIADLKYPPNKTVGFVPTMGAFHEGHLNLMRRAVEGNDLTVVSLFVNPTQFGKNEDFSRYPRDLEKDASMAESAGVDILFAPDVREIYPRETCTIHVPEVTELWEGAVRPGHFDGVATVVAKLFNIVRPDRAYFGQKDLQQCRVIARMMEDLNFGFELKIEPTTRESDGLAMSSRNVYLSGEERASAPLLYAELSRCAANFADISRTDIVRNELNLSREKLAANGFIVDYFELVDRDDLKPLSQNVGHGAIIVAAKLGRTRLIDNVIF